MVHWRFCALAQEAWVQSLSRELRSHMPRCLTKTKKIKFWIKKRQVKKLLLGYWKALPVHSPEIRAEHTLPISTRRWPFPSCAVGERWGEEAIFIALRGVVEMTLKWHLGLQGCHWFTDHFFFLGLSFPSETWGGPSGWLLSTEVQRPLTCWSPQHLCHCPQSELEINTLHSSLSLGLLSS